MILHTVHWSLWVLFFVLDFVVYKEEKLSKVKRGSGIAGHFTMGTYIETVVCKKKKKSLICLNILLTFFVIFVYLWFFDLVLSRIERKLIKWNGLFNQLNVKLHLDFLWFWSWFAPIDSYVHTYIHIYIFICISSLTLFCHFLF